MSRIIIWLYHVFRNMIFYQNWLNRRTRDERSRLEMHQGFPDWVWGEYLSEKIWNCVGWRWSCRKKNFWTNKEISPQPNSHEILLYRELLAGPMDYNHFNTEHGGWKLTSCTLTCWNMYPRARGQTGAREEVKGPGEETSLIIREDYSDHYHHKSAK